MKDGYLDGYGEYLRSERLLALIADFDRKRARYTKTSPRKTAVLSYAVKRLKFDLRLSKPGRSRLRKGRLKSTTHLDRSENMATRRGQTGEESHVTWRDSQISERKAVIVRSMSVDSGLMLSHSNESDNVNGHDIFGLDSFFTRLKYV